MNTQTTSVSVSAAEAKYLRRAESTEWVARVIRDRIAEGDLLPGVKLAEEVLCEALGVSRNTLREGFATLRSEGIVVRIPNRGVFVKRPSVDDVREMYRARRIIEPASILWGTGPLTGLSEIVERGRRGIANVDVSEMASANQDFHRAIVARSESLRLKETMDRILVEMRLVFHGMSSDSSFHLPYVEHNAAIVRQLERGETASAADAMMHYLAKAEAQLTEAMTTLVTY